MAIFDATDPTQIDAGDTGAPGTAGVAARRDHGHAVYSTSDGQTNVNTLLQSDANGRLRLAALGVGAAAGADNRALVYRDDDFSTAYNATTDNILLVRNVTVGSGVVLGSIGFSQAGNPGDQRSGAAIAAIQTGSDANEVGLVFYTHPTAPGADPIVEAVRIDHEGKVGIGVSPAYQLDVRAGTIPTYVRRDYASDGSTERDVLHLERRYSEGNGAAGIGGRLRLRTENDAGEGISAANIHWALTTVTDGSEEGRLRISAIDGGTPDTTVADFTGSYISFNRPVVVGSSSPSGELRLVDTSGGAELRLDGAGDAYAYNYIHLWSSGQSPDRRWSIQHRNDSYAGVIFQYYDGSSYYHTFVIRNPTVTYPVFYSHTDGRVSIGNTTQYGFLDVRQQTATGPTLYVYRNLASGSTDSALLSVVNDHASDDQATVSVRQDGTGDQAVFYDGASLTFSIKNAGALQWPALGGNPVRIAHDTTGDGFAVYEDVTGWKGLLSVAWNSGNPLNIVLDFNNLATAAQIDSNAPLKIATTGSDNITLEPGGYVILDSSKTTTGNPTAVEGLIYWNTVDNAIRMYADGGWRTLITW